MKIYAPNIHIFAFQLYKGSNFNDNIDSKDLNFIWECGDTIVRETLHQDLQLSQKIDVNKQPEFNKVDILQDAEVAVYFEGEITPNPNQDILVKGFAQPLRISDSYGLWLNLRRPEKENNQDTEELETDFLKLLNPNNCLIFPEHPLFIGQTILITAWLNNAKNKNNSQQIADECLLQIFPNQNTAPPFYRQGELFGSPIFEYGLPTQSSQYQQVLIWLFTDEKADQQFNQCYQELLDLFFYRHKIIKAYKDSRIIYKLLDTAYRKIEYEVDNIPEPENTQGVTSKYLKALQKQLKAFPKLAFQYTRLLLNLEDAQNTIAINADNSGNIDFLENFLNKNCVTFQRQIQADLGYFRHGSQLLDQAINSIRGIVEIEQTESDRSLEKTIQILGIGFGGGGIVSGVVTSNIEKINRPIAFISPHNPPHPFYASLILSIIATFLFIIVGWLITKRK
jgi:predicted ester cyclase